MTRITAWVATRWPTSRPRATVLAVLHRVQAGELSAADAYRCLDLLGLVEMAREMRAARKGRAA